MTYPNTRGETISSIRTEPRRLHMRASSERFLLKREDSAISLGSFVDDVLLGEISVTRGGNDYSHSYSDRFSPYHGDSSSSLGDEDDNGKVVRCGEDALATKERRRRLSQLRSSHYESNSSKNEKTDEDVDDQSMDGSIRSFSSWLSKDGRRKKGSGSGSSSTSLLSGQGSLGGGSSNHSQKRVSVLGRMLPWSGSVRFGTDEEDEDLTNFSLEEEDVFSFSSKDKNSMQFHNGSKISLGLPNQGNKSSKSPSDGNHSGKSLLGDSQVLKTVTAPTRKKLQPSPGPWKDGKRPHAESEKARRKKAAETALKRHHSQERKEKKKDDRDSPPPKTTRRSSHRRQPKEDKDKDISRISKTTRRSSSRGHRSKERNNKEDEDSHPSRSTRRSSHRRQPHEDKDENMSSPSNPSHRRVRRPLRHSHSADTASSRQHRRPLRRSRSTGQPNTRHHIKAVTARPNRQGSISLGRSSLEGGEETPLHQLIMEGGGSLKSVRGHTNTVAAYPNRRHCTPNSNAREEPPLRRLISGIHIDRRALRSRGERTRKTLPPRNFTC